MFFKIGFALHGAREITQQIIKLSDYPPETFSFVSLLYLVEVAIV